MLRRSASLAGQLLGRQLAAAGACSAAEGGALVVAAEGSARALGIAPALQLFDRWQQGSSHSQSAAGFSHAGFHLRHFSSSNSWQQELSDGGDAAAAAAAAAEAAPQLDLSQVLDPTSIVQAATLAESAAIAEAGVDLWAPTVGIQQLLVLVQSLTGLDWWASIMLTTFGVRLITFPVALFQIKNTYKLSQARPEIEKLVEWMKTEQARGNPNAVKEHQNRMWAVYSKYDANPLKSMVPLFVQFPIFVGFFSALRSFANVKLPSMTEGGALWFQDLTVADPTYMLPVLSALTFLLTVELGAGDGMEGQPEQVKRRMKNVMRFIAVAMIPFTLNMPASVFCYWGASNIFALGQALLLKVPSVKKALGLPDLKTAHLSEEAKLVGKRIVTYAQPPPTLRAKPGSSKSSRLERALDKAAAKNSGSGRQ